MAHRIILDTDPGIDDAMAIFLACASPEILIEGLTIVAGNTSNVDLMARNAAFLLYVSGKTDTPVYKGARKPIARDFCNRGGPLFHGETGLGGIPLPDSHWDDCIQEEPAHRFLAQKCLENPGEITIVTVGPLTNLAQAITDYPEMVSAVKSLYIMGGAIDHRGNKTPAAEANFVNDPEAARVVMDAFPNITLAGLNVTHSVHTQDWFLHELRSNCGHLGTISDCMLKHYIRASQLYGSGGVHMHDSTAIMAIIRPDLFTTQRTRVQVETKGEYTYGASIADWNGVYGLTPQTDVLMTVDEAGFLREYLDRIKSLSSAVVSDEIIKIAQDINDAIHGSDL